MPGDSGISDAIAPSRRSSTGCSGGARPASGAAWSRRRGQARPAGSAFLPLHAARLLGPRASADTFLPGSADFREDPLFLPTEVRRFWKRSVRGTSKDPSLPTRRISPGSFSWGGGGCWGEGPHSSISVGCRNGGTHLGAYLQCGLPGLRLGMKRRLELTRPGADSQMARKLSQDVN